MSTPIVPARRSPSPPPPAWPRRATYAAATVAMAAFVVYGSLVPLRFTPRPLDEALAHFRRVPYLELGIESRADLVSNVLLFVPLGYLLLAALRTDRVHRTGDVITGAFVVGGCGLSSLALEFIQMFFPPRTVSQNDLIAETSGAFIGVLLWLAVGRPVTSWLRGFAAARERPAFLQYLLLGYGVAFVSSQLLPLDVTINLGQLADKFRMGRIVLVPFSHAYTSVALMIWDYASDVFLNAPIGAATVVLWTRNGQRRRLPAALALGGAIVALVELAQVFIYTRFADTTDLITGGVGVVIGALVATTLSAREASPVDRRQVSRLALKARIGALLWIACLASYHWAPFDFSLDPERLRAGVHQILSTPMTGYYFGTEFNALTQVMRKSLLALPLGALLRLSWPPAVTRDGQRLHLLVVVAVGAIVLGGIETGQILLPGRFPDLADVMVGLAGVIAGFWLMSRVLAGR